MAGFSATSIVCVTALVCSYRTGTTAMAMAVHEIDTTSGLFRRAVEVYLRQKNETDFDQFRLQYDGSTQTIDVSVWDYQDVAQPTRAQLIGLLVQAKRRLAHLTEHKRRREKNKRRANIPPAVYVQQGTSYTGTGVWGAVPIRERGMTSPTSAVVDDAGLYRVSLSGKCTAGAGGWLRVLDRSKTLILRSEHRLVGGTEASYSDLIDVELVAGEQLVVQQQGTATVTITLTVESIIPA